MNDPVTVTCATACTVTHVISIETPLLNLTVEEGAAIAGAVLAVWALGWAFRVFIQQIRQTGGNSSTTESE
ncbi:hypothetical protein [Ramlibacter sp.]|uniref:hypothetical protein n=1 Tax=Ramlibacter sp. TaxID=1917967 RepID=UPI00179AFBB9|nr:hypothetical protein [Ramlibacter sp.]MBA2676135.1 hypothetical protein [Ramlibacter sp.]